MKIALLTGGQDPPYARGLLRQLLMRGVDVACVGSDELAGSRSPGPGSLEFHNLVGSQEPASAVRKVWRVLRYYGRLVVFAARSDAVVFHILWFRKFPRCEGTLLNVYFKLLGKKLVYTAHNVDGHARDGKPGSVLDTLALRFLYRSVDHILVHTPAMKRELVERFGVANDKVTVVPFGINDVIPVATMSRMVARERLGVAPDARALLFFGNIAPYKGLEDLLRALAELVAMDKRFTLLLAGPVRDKSCQPYWTSVQGLIESLGLREHVRKTVDYIPDGDVGMFFRAADVSVLPYRRIYQSGVLALSYAQGLPAIVADAGSLAEQVSEGKTGFVFQPGDVAGLVRKVHEYFASDVFENLELASEGIRAYGVERFSWSSNADTTVSLYERLMPRREQARASIHA
jgi:glycosyltransferase involved in cell wall biosynthesis